MRAQSLGLYAALKTLSVWPRSAAWVARYDGVRASVEVVERLVQAAGGAALVDPVAQLGPVVKERFMRDCICALSGWRDQRGLVGGKLGQHSCCPVCLISGSLLGDEGMSGPLNRISRICAGSLGRAWQALSLRALGEPIRL